MPTKKNDAKPDNAKVNGEDVLKDEEAEVSEAEVSKMTPEQREAHRERVRKSATARNAAMARLVKAHEAEYNEYHEEEKARVGIKSRTAAKAEREAAKLQELIGSANEDFLREALAKIEAAKAAQQEQAEGVA